MSAAFSRRKMIVGAGAALAAGGIGATAMAGGGELSGSDRAVTAISGSSKNFLSAVAALFPGLQKDPGFQKLSPLAILIAHQSGPGIRAHTVAWQVTTPKGSYETALVSYVSPGAAAKGFSSSTLGSARKDLLAPGQSRLVTPFFNWTPAYYAANPKVNWNAMSTEPGRFLVSEAAVATHIDVYLDAVVFSDWKLVGPDNHNLTRRLRSRRNAEHDEAVHLYRLMKSGASEATLTSTLEAHADAERSSSLNSPFYWYREARRYQAQALLRAFENTNRATFETAIRRLVKQKRTKITRVSV